MGQASKLGTGNGEPVRRTVAGLGRVYSTSADHTPDLSSKRLSPTVILNQTLHTRIYTLVSSTDQTTGQRD